MRKLLVFIGVIAMSSLIFAKNIVITSIQPLYSLVSCLVEGTNIEVYTPFGSDVSMSISRESIRDEEFNLEIAKKAQAVVDISKIWTEDSIYGKAREYNINIIEIDASYSYDDKLPTLFFNEYSNGKINPFVWTGSKNLVKMANIVTRDLVRIYPKYKDKIEKNAVIFTKRVVEEEKEANEKLLMAGANEVISLSENLQYFLNDLNIYAEYIDYSSINENNAKDIIKEKNIKTIVSDRWLKKKVIKAIEEAGGKFVIINTLDIPLDYNGKMHPDALLETYRDNTAKLIENL